MNINLIIGEDLSKRDRRKTVIKNCLIAVFFFSILIFATNLYCDITIKVKKDKFKGMEARYRKNRDLVREVAQLKEEIDRIKAETTLIETSLYKNFLWSEKILNLSKMIPDQIWLSLIKVTPKGDMVLRGYFLPPEAKDMTLTILNDFIKKLQENSEFVNDFSEVSLGNVRSVSLKGRNIFEFTITMVTGEKTWQ
ncbi:MAG: hypothetical protein PHV17_03020 [Candidatus Omnitrophica bacterium]|nr:hypothetical protein [Candidatus Omnitrophota bacterium]